MHRHVAGRVCPRHAPFHMSPWPFIAPSSLRKAGRAPAAVTLPCLTALVANLRADTVLIATDTPGQLEALPAARLQPLAQELRQRLTENVALESRHIEEQRSLLLKCSFLDPRFRAMHFCTQSDKEATIQALYEEAARIPGFAHELEEENSDHGQPVSARDMFLQAMQGDKPVQNAKQRRKALREQLATYGHGANLALDTEPLHFWQEHADALKFLVPLARRYGAVPATTADAERVFSMAKHYFTDSRLSSDSVDKVMQISLNLPEQGLWQDGDIHSH